MARHAQPQTAAELGLMQGGRPASDRLVTLANWQDPPFNRWAFQHFRELVPTARDRAGRRAGRRACRARRATSTACGLPRPAAGAPRARPPPGGDLHRRLPRPAPGRVVCEQYFNGMTPATPHLLQSVSKSITGTLAGIMSRAASSTRRARHQLRARARRHELRRRPAARRARHAHRHAVQRGLRRPAGRDAGSTSRSSAGARRPTRRRPTTSTRTSPASRTPGRTAARSSTAPSSPTCSAGSSRAPAGARFADLLSRELWARIGAEHDAEVAVDGHGHPVADGGISVTLRDLARFGQCHAANGSLQRRRR